MIYFYKVTIHHGWAKYYSINNNFVVKLCNNGQLSLPVSLIMRHDGAWPLLLFIYVLKHFDHPPGCQLFLGLTIEFFRCAYCHFMMNLQSMSEYFWKHLVERSKVARSKVHKKLNWYEKNLNESFGSVSALQWTEWNYLAVRYK